ncbi:MAG TPA: IPT/TIG domain-containing protein [Polyangiaceae bacterium]|nr:IPT/TIG domain-containing protein [Polyangiaceae bacterium]
MRRVLLLWGLAQLAGCLSQGPPISLRPVNEGDASTRITSDVPVADASFEFGPMDPHALIGVDPSHGPFSGGQARIVRGNGFGNGLRVWFGATEVPSKDIVPVDPSRAQVIVPAGTAGSVAVKTQIASDMSTARVLAGAYLYEDFYGEPSTGGTSGGTLVHWFGQGTTWGPETTVTIDDKACEPVQVIAPTEITCTTPAAPAGTKSVKIGPSAGASIVRDGFTFADTDNGYTGGLSGTKLATRLKVLAYDTYSGAPLPGAYVLAGDDPSTGWSKLTDASGLALFDDPALGPKRSVTVAAKCHQPVTFVDVPVDVVTAYLTPVLTPACTPAGDNPATGGRAGSVSTLKGEIVWGVDGEFRSLAWKNIPTPGPTERLVAYVFRLTADPAANFALPAASESIRPDSAGGKVGFPFTMTTSLGNATLYALAGIEDRSGAVPKFTAYAMGLVRGVAAALGQTTSDIFIPIDIRLDHAVSLTVKAPPPGPRGPDRARLAVSLEVERGGFAVIPAGIVSSTLPVDRTVAFVGLPPLTGALASGRFVGTGIAATGPTLTTPLSQVGRVGSTSESITMSEFLPVPVLTDPALGGAWDGRHLAFEFAPGVGTVDLTVLQLQSAAGLVTWTVVVPGGGSRTVSLPDLRRIFPQGALVPGNISITVLGGRLQGFDYAAMRYGQLSPSGFDAYAMDVFPARFE